MLSNKTNELSRSVSFSSLNSIDEIFSDENLSAEKSKSIKSFERKFIVSKGFL